MFNYGVSNRGVVRDESGDLGPQNVGIIHAFQWDWHLAHYFWGGVDIDA